MRPSIGLLLVFSPFISAFSPTAAVPVGPIARSSCRGRGARRLPPARDVPRVAAPPTTTRRHAYGKGSEIWPECNEAPVLLAASFPGGVVPRPARRLLEAAAAPSAAAAPFAPPTAAATPDPAARTRGAKRRAVRRTLAHLLRSAAQASTRRARSVTATEREAVYGVPPPAIDKGPAVLALALVATRCVAMEHAAAAVGLSAYFVGLASWCAAPRRGGTDRRPVANMPSLPAKGHVPTLITNPLGASLTNSRGYRNWLRVGALLGVLLPTAILAKWCLGSQVPAILAMAEWMNVSNVGAAKRIVGGPLFLLCCQALTEAVARTALLPLPIRILIPVAYNTLRLSALRPWAFPPAPAALPASLRALGLTNLVYWQANLLFFLVPVGMVRYLRAHFFCVEAAEVTVREGGEGAVGLLP